MPVPPLQKSYRRRSNSLLTAKPRLPQKPGLQILQRIDRRIVHIDLEVQNLVHIFPNLLERCDVAVNDLRAIGRVQRIVEYNGILKDLLRNQIVLLAIMHRLTAAVGASPRTAITVTGLILRAFWIRVRNSLGSILMPKALGSKRMR